MTGVLPANEIQIYTWPDATLKEISELVKDVLVPNYNKQRNSTLLFALVYPDRSGTHVIKQVSACIDYRKSF